MSVINYPDGRKAIVRNEENKAVDHRKTENRTEQEKVRDSYIKANMGLGFEDDVIKSCEYYKLENKAVIYKRPTPIKIVHMSKEKKGMIDQAYFQEKSTTDFVGIYKAKYIDFECKETIHDTVPYSMIREQQLLHLDQIDKMGGIAFFLVSFKSYQEVYLIKARIILDEIAKKGHPGFKREFFMENAVRVERSYVPAYKLLDAIDKAFGI